MNDPELTKQIIAVVGGMLGAFGAVVGIASVIFKARGKPIAPLWTRYAAWFVIIPVILIPLLLSRAAFQAVIVLLSLLCFREYSHATGLWKDRKITLACYAAIAIIAYPVFDNWYGLYQAMPIYAIAFILLVPILRGAYEHMVQKTCLAVLGVAYFGWFFRISGFCGIMMTVCAISPTL